MGDQKMTTASKDVIYSQTMTKNCGLKIYGGGQACKYHINTIFISYLQPKFDTSRIYTNGTLLSFGRIPGFDCFESPDDALKVTLVQRLLAHQPSI